MVLITQDAAVSIDLTLTELVTITNPYYLFVFTNKQTGKVDKCLLSDVSVYPERYNRFVFTEGSSLTLIQGDYTLQVYQVATATTTIPTTGLLETDIARVSLNPLTETEYSSDITTNPIVYESQN